MFTPALVEKLVKSQGTLSFKNRLLTFINKRSITGLLSCILSADFVKTVEKLWLHNIISI